MFLVSIRRQDEGQALVMVLTMMVLLGGIIAIIAMMSVFSIGFTSQTRASAQSVAAAEAGLEEVGAVIFNEACLDPVVDELGGSPAYTADVYRQVNASDGFVPGCPVVGDYAFKIVSTGYAAHPGGSGYNLGDTETLEALWVRHSPPPRFEDAVRGDVYVGTAGVAGILSDANDANVYTVGDFYCPAGATIEGSVVVGGNARWTQSTCQVTGDLYVGGDLQYNIDSGGSSNVGGDLYIVGNFTHNLGKTHGSFDAGSNQNHIGVDGIVRVGGLVDAYCRFSGHGPNTDWSGYSNSPGTSGIPASCGTGSDSRVQMRVPGLSVGENKDFEVLTVDSEPFSTWTPVEWDTMTGVAPGSVSHGRRINGSTCSNHPWNGSAVIDVTENTVIDTTSDCSGGVLLGDHGGLTINLSADLAIFANYFYGNGNVTINSADGDNHSLYLIDPLPIGTSPDWTCPSTVPNPSAAAGGIQLSSGAWNQANEIAVLAYSPGTFNSARSNWTLGGQVYSCRSDFQSGFYLDFRRVEDATPSTGFDSYGVRYVRPS